MKPKRSQEGPIPAQSVPVLWLMTWALIVGLTTAYLFGMLAGIAMAIGYLFLVHAIKLIAQVWK